MKFNAFTQDELTTLSGGKDVSTPYETRGVHWHKVTNATPYFMQVLDDNGNVSNIVPPWSVSTQHVAQDTERLTIASRVDLAKSTANTAASTAWAVYVEFGRDQVPLENYHFM